MSALISTSNTSKAERIVRGMWEDSDLAKAHEDAAFSTDFEHGQWWVTCRPCGAQYSVSDALPGIVCFEEVTRGEEDAHY